MQGTQSMIAIIQRYGGSVCHPNGPPINQNNVFIIIQRWRKKIER